MRSVQVIRKVDRRLDDILHEEIPIIKKIKKFVIQSGGKRIRPITHYYFARILGYEGEESIDVGAIGEMIHATSLLHDDVIDESPVRRGKPTINSLHGNKKAVLAGDYLLASVLDHIRTLSAPDDLLRIFTRVIRMLSVGELLQMEWEGRMEIKSKVYDRIILGKTASLFGAMTESAAVLAGLSAKEQQIYREFGEKMGWIFQIRDDYLDYFGDLESNGKETFQDMRRGLVTRPVILLRDKLSPRDRKKLKELWASPERRASAEGWEQFLTLSEKSSVRKLLAQEIEETIHELMLILRKHPDSAYRQSIMKHLNKLLVPVDV